MGASLRFCTRWAWRFSVISLLIVCGTVLAHSVLQPPKTYFMNQEARRLGAIKYQWASVDDIAPVMMRSVVAAEDANYCLHWGFDMDAIRKVIAEGANRGASTLTQQVVKNTYLWHGRNYLRKALEAAMTPLVELFWSKKRIVEVYVNIAEFDEGVFGVAAASQHYFGTTASELTPTQAARLAAVLPSPKTRSASKPTAKLRKRAASIMDGAQTIRLDGRSACFED